MKTSNNSITYFEYYPHFQGNLVCSAKLSVEVLTLMHLARKAEDDDLFEDLVDSVEEENKVKIFAMFEAVDQFNKVMKALISKGFWADQWEEGSHFFALPGFEVEAKAAMFQIEAGILADTY